MSLINVEVVYALPGRQTVLVVAVPAGASALTAVHASGILQQCPDIDEHKLELGIFGNPVAHDHPLKAGDRVEVYRPLLQDPMEARKRRAQSQRR